MCEIYLERPFWGAIIQLDECNIDVVCNHRLLKARFFWKNQSLTFSHVHRDRSVRLRFVGVIPRIDVKKFLQVHKPKIHASKLAHALVELTHFLCERHGANHSSRLFQLRPWRGCDFGMGSTINLTQQCVEANFLPCVQEVARVTPQLDGVGLVCNCTYGIRKHQPICFFSGEVLSNSRFYQLASDSIIESERSALPCDRTAYSVEFGDGHVMDCWKVRGYASAANHACGKNANACVQLWKVAGCVFLMLVATQEIAFNRPILLDYGHETIQRHNKVCYGVYCSNSCGFEAQCRLLEDGCMVVSTGAGETILPRPPKHIKELSVNPSHCYVSIRKSVLFSHLCVFLFFSQSRNHYSWKISSLT